jgi:glycosylphosphatidylinositol transamidase (GPIT) subunit GPI8
LLWSVIPGTAAVGTAAVGTAAVADTVAVVNIVVAAVDNYYYYFVVDIAVVAAVDSCFADRHLDPFDILSVDIG